MQKIDKSQILSTNYKTWHNSLGDNHPTYNSSNNKYYNEIKMCLLHCQKGLCAYTEEMLCDEKYFDISNWKNGKYTPLTQIQKNEIQGDLEHFDESLKTQKGWLWDNLFIVDTHVNCRIKHRKPIKNILKPDSPTYDPYKYLDFDYETGVFFPNINLTQQENDDVAYMIEVLGINCISSQRKKQLQDWKDKIDVGLDVQPYRFITAWNMTLSKKT
jgi:hypothetical protein